MRQDGHRTFCIPGMPPNSTQARPPPSSLGPDGRQRRPTVGKPPAGPMLAAALRALSPPAAPGTASARAPGRMRASGVRWRFRGRLPAGQRGPSAAAQLQLAQQGAPQPRLSILPLLYKPHRESGPRWTGRPGWPWRLPPGRGDPRGGPGGHTERREELRAPQGCLIRAPAHRLAALTGSALVVAPPLLRLGHGRSGAGLASRGPSLGLGLSAPPRPGISDNQPIEEQDGFLLQRLCEADFPVRGSGGDWRKQAEDEQAAKAEIPVKARKRSRCIFLLSDTWG